MRHVVFANGFVFAGHQRQVVLFELRAKNIQRLAHAAGPAQQVFYRGGVGQAIEVDPVSLSLADKDLVRNKEVVPINGLPLFGGLRDAAPDAWGRRVIEAKLKVPANSLPESTYLLEAGSDRVGALDVREALLSPASKGVSGVQFRRATLKLEVEPQITPDGRVILDLDVAKDSVGEQTDAGPAINTKHVQTRVEVEDGGTVSIGGIYASDDRNDVTRVPLLGKIPLLGALFRHTAHRDQRSELVVFITPRVVQTN